MVDAIFVILEEGDHFFNEREAEVEFYCFLIKLQQKLLRNLNGYLLIRAILKCKLIELHVLMVDAVPLDFLGDVVKPECVGEYEVGVHVIDDIVLDRFVVIVQLMILDDRKPLHDLVGGAR